MKTTNFVSILLYATLTVAHTDFIKDGQRAELFEILDHEVAEFRVTVPPSEFQTIKSEINGGGFGFGNGGGFGFGNGGGFGFGNGGGFGFGNGGGFGNGLGGGLLKRQWQGDIGFNGGNMGGGNMGGGNMGGGNMGGGFIGGMPNMDFGIGGGNMGGGNMGGGNMGGGFIGGMPNMGGGNMGGGFIGGMPNMDFGMGGGNMGGGLGFLRENYKTKNATMIVKINGGSKSFDKVTFKIGGSSSRTYARQAFNIKIRGSENLYGRQEFRIRSDAREATYLRSKLACDMHNRLGLPSISANYISLYVNEEYWGFYVLMDSPKPKWAEIEYGDVDTTHLFKCKAGGLTLSSTGSNCENENDEFTDFTEWRTFIQNLDRASTISEANTIFDVDQFLYEMAYEYLSGSWDHYLCTGHNFSVYKMPANHGGKWTMIHYDFDADFGQDVCAVEFMGSIKTDKDYPSWSFDDWSTKRTHLLDILIKQDRSRFNQIMKRFVEEVFNPDVLFPRIDELKDFIRPYVQKDKTPGANGKKPGMLNESANDDYTMAQWEANSEFTNIGVSASSSGYGLKFWILNRYRRVCKDFPNITCIPEYLDLNYYYEIDRSVEGPINTEFVMPFPGVPQRQNNTPKTTQSQPPKPANYQPTTRKTATTTRAPVNTIAPVAPVIPPNTNSGCSVQALGYPCCSPTNIEIIYQDENGDWGMENGNWCGITKSSTCWSQKLGFPCCSSCLPVVLTDNDGKWSMENDDWCGIPTNC